MSWGGCRTSSGAPGTLRDTPARSTGGLVFASEMPWATATAGADNPVRRDVNYYDKPIALNGRVYPKSLWTHAFADATPADIVFDVADQRFESFKAHVGLDDASGGGSVQFQVFVDGELKSESPVLRTPGSCAASCDRWCASSRTARPQRRRRLQLRPRGLGQCAIRAIWRMLELEFSAWSLRSSVFGVRCHAAGGVAAWWGPAVCRLAVQPLCSGRG